MQQTKRSAIATRHPPVPKAGISLRLGPMNIIDNLCGLPPSPSTRKRDAFAPKVPFLEPTSLYFICHSRINPSSLGAVGDIRRPAWVKNRLPISQCHPRPTMKHAKTSRTPWRPMPCSKETSVQTQRRVGSETDLDEKLLSRMPVEVLCERSPLTSARGLVCPIVHDIR